MKRIAPTGMRSDTIRQKLLLTTIALALLLTSCGQPVAPAKVSPISPLTGSGDVHVDNSVRLKAMQARPAKIPFGHLGNRWNGCASGRIGVWTDDRKKCQLKILPRETIPHFVVPH